ncbi:tocopherol cyclase family protein [Ornithinimicrobium kibberense]|uniref:Tocopherol cyclase family protein n=1 Tax=Ornithinimicrobium kibberense TaxID=282060 RepID=A0ABV5UZA9_9MICO|nr:tocopherol cyclase family protein [Ornithinimicrobium kibberense]
MRGITPAPPGRGTGLLARYRGTGADLPWQDPRRSHPGVAMEGYFWRVSDVASGRALIALVGVNQGPDGPWATVGLATSDGFLRTAALPGAEAAPHGLGARGGRAGDGWAIEGTAHRLTVDLGPDARVDLRLEPHHPWPRTLGGSSVFHVVPRLNQYWHPWLLGGRATGTVVVGEDAWTVDDAQVYGEKNWGHEGFPDAWWWGQAHGFAEPGACVAFAGGQVHATPLGMPLRTEVTALVRLPSGRVLRLGDPVVTPVDARVGDDTWRLRGVDRFTGWRVEVDATSPLQDAHVLPVPLPSQARNTPGALEHLAGTLEVRVARRGRQVWGGTSYLAGLEHGGLARAEAELARRGGRPEPYAPGRPLR